MKRLFLSIGVLAVAIIIGLFACQKQKASSTSPDGVNSLVQFRQSPVIGYENEKGNFVPISDANLIAYYQHLDILSSEATIETIEVREVTDEANNHGYIVYGHGIDGSYHVSISSLLDVYQDNPGTLKLNGKTCTCKSENCSGAWDCDANLTPSGSCSCSPCTGEGSKCEKTSTTSSLVAISQFFESIGVVE